MAAPPSFALAAGLRPVVLSILAGLALIVAGMALLKHENRKPKRNAAAVVLAYALLAIGVAIGLGVGSDVFLSNVQAEL